MKEWLVRIFMALFGFAWRLDAFHYYLGIGMSKKFAKEKMQSITRSEWNEIIIKKYL